MKANWAIGLSLVAGMAVGLVAFPRSAPAPAPRASTDGSAAEPVSIALSREVGYDIRPSYQITVDGEGMVRFDGRSGIGIVKGHQTAQIRPAQVRKLLAEFDKAHFASLRERYDAGVSTVAETVTLSLSVGDSRKTVVRSSEDRSAPVALVQLADTVDRIAGTHRWLGDAHFPNLAAPVADKKAVSPTAASGPRGASAPNIR
jgi:hypothetical protein